MTGTPAQVITWMMARLQTHPNAVFEVTLKKEKRTRSQNAYYWVLLSKVAQKLTVRCVFFNCGGLDRCAASADVSGYEHHRANKHRVSDYHGMVHEFL